MAEENEDETEYHPFADDPITSAAQDRLDRGPFAARAADLLADVAASSTSNVAGLIGAWGSGKSSVLAMLEENIEARSGWEVVRYNPWALSDLPTLIVEFFAAIRDALPAQSEARRALAGYVGRIAPLTSLLSAIPLIGIDPSKGLEAIADRLDGDQSLTSQRDRLVEALRTSPVKVLVLIDDVDRLHGDELLMVLKLVRLVGRLPNVSYVLAYDEKTILDVLAGTELGAGNPARALAYLDKIVQLRLDLPAVSTYRLQELVNEGIGRALARAGVVLGERERERLSSAYFDCLSTGLDEPRNVKRYFAQVEALHPLVAPEVDLVDFLLITYLRVFHPSLHRDLRDHKEELTGTKLLAGGDDKPQAIGARWRERLLDRHDVDADDVDGLLELLGVMFPKTKPHGSPYPNPERGICHAEYFDRYLYLAVAPDDVADADVAAALAEAAAGRRGHATSLLLERLDAAGAAVVAKLDRQSASGAAARNLVVFAAEVAARVPAVGVLGFAPRRAQLWARDLLATATVDDPDALLAEMAEHLPVNTVAMILAGVKGDDVDGRGFPRHLTAFAARVGAALWDHLQAMPSVPAAQLTELSWTLSQWVHFAGDEAAARDWVRVQVTAGRWDIADLVAQFTPVTLNDSNEPAGLMAFDDHGMERYVGIRWALERFTPDVIDEPKFSAWLTGMEPSFENRRIMAHLKLAEHAAAGGSEPA